MKGTNAYDLMIFEGGKNEFRKAEITCLQRRKESSDKPKKEPKKEPEVKRCPKLKRRHPDKTREFSEKDINKTMKNLQSALVRKFGGGVSGWSIVLDLEEEQLRSRAQSVLNDECAWKKAISDLVDDINENRKSPSPNKDDDQKS